MSISTKYHLVFEQVNLLINANPRDMNRRQQINALVKKCLSLPTYLNSCKIELDTRLQDGISPKDVPYVIKILLDLNSHLKGTTIHIHDMKYVLFSVIVTYLLDSTEPAEYDYDSLRMFFDNIFDLVEVDPFKYHVRSFKPSCFCS